MSLLDAVRSGGRSAGGRTDVDLSSIISPGRTQTLRLRYASRPRLALKRIPYLVSHGSDEKTIAAVGDIACSPKSSQWNGGFGTPTACRQADVADLTSRSDDAVLLLGDIQYPAGTLDQFKRGFGPSWGHLGTRLRPVPGNHEYYTPGAAGYFRYFRDLGVQTGRSRGGYYSFPLGAWTVIALNSNCSRVSCKAGSRQEQWFRKRLKGAAAAGRCTLAFWHHAPASSGWHGNQVELAALWRAFVELGGDLLLTGHDHHYERFGPMGPDLEPDATGSPAWVIGTGGKSLRSAANEALESAVVIDDTFGLARFRLLSSSFTWQWAGLGGAGGDAGSASCRG